MKNFVLLIGLTITILFYMGCDDEDSPTSPSGEINTVQAPTDLKAFVLSDTQMLLTWMDRSDNETGFEIEQKIGSGSFALLTTVAAGTESDTVTGLDWQNAYSYRIRSVNASSSSEFSTVVNVTGIRPVDTLESHTGPVWSVEYSPDGTHIASGSWDRKVKTWTLSDGEVERTLRSGNEFWDVAYNSTGDLLVSGGGDRVVTVWDAATGGTIQAMRGHRTEIRSVSVSPDGQYIASGSRDSGHPVKIWNPNDGMLIDSLAEHTKAVLSVCFSPDGAQLATGSIDETLKLWSVSNGFGLERTINVGAGVLSLRYSSDGQYLLSGSGYPDFAVTVWNPSNGQTIMTLEGHTDDVLSVDISPNGDYIVSGSMDGTVKVWDAINGKLLQTLWGHSGVVSSVAFSVDGQTIASGSEDSSIIIWGTF